MVHKANKLMNNNIMKLSIPVIQNKVMNKLFNVLFPGAENKAMDKIYIKLMNIKLNARFPVTIEKLNTRSSKFMNNNICNFLGAEND